MTTETEPQPQAVTPTPRPPDVYPAIVDKFLEHGYSEEACGKILGGNMVRVFDQVWK